MTKTATTATPEPTSEDLNDTAIHGFVRFVDIEAPEGDIDLSDGSVAQAMVADTTAFLERAMSARDSLAVVGEGEYLISFGTSEIESATQSLRRHVSELRSALFHSSPTLEILLDSHVEQIQIIGNAAPETIYADLRKFAPHPDVKARLDDAESLTRGRGHFQPYWSPKHLQTGANHVAIEMPDEVRRRLRKNKREEVRLHIQALHDREHLQRAIWASTSTASGRGRTDYLVPVHASTFLDNDLAKTYLEGFGGQMRSMAGRLVVEIVHLRADEVDAFARSAALATLRKVGIKVIVATSLQEAGALRTLYPMLHGISCTMTSTRVMKDIATDCAQWARFSEISGLEVHLNGANSFAHARIAAEAGVTWIRGNAVQFSADLPKAPQAFSGVGFKNSSAA